MTSGNGQAELARPTCERWREDDEQRMYPLHEEWADGEIDGREYRILRSLQGPHILIEFEDMDSPMTYELGDLLTHAHAKTSGIESTERSREEGSR